KAVDAQLIECSIGERGISRRPNQEPYPVRSAGLLRARCERPRCRTAKQRDELAAATHSMTSSARASNGGGTVRPSAFAVIRFTIRSNLVGCSTARLAGFAPRRILST